MTLDPIVGFDEIGDTQTSSSINYLIAFGPFAAEATGTISAVSIYHSLNTPADATYGVYDDNANPEDLLSDTDGGAWGAGPTWDEQTLDSPVGVTNGVDYWIAKNHNTAAVYLYHDVNVNFRAPYKADTHTPGSLDDPFGSLSGTLSNRKMSAFATITEAGGGIAPMQDHLARLRAG